MIINAQKCGNLLSIEIPLNQYPLTSEKIARYIMCLYEFNFIPEHTKCFITLEFDNDLYFYVKPDVEGNFLERTFPSRLRMMPSSYFKNTLEEAGFEVIETSQKSWEISKK